MAALFLHLLILQTNEAKDVSICEQLKMCLKSCYAYIKQIAYLKAFLAALQLFIKNICNRKWSFMLHFS